MNVEQVNVSASSYREAMNASAAPVSTTGAGGRSDFMGTLEQSSVTIDNKFNSEITQIGNKTATEAEDRGREIAQRNDERRSSRNEDDAAVEEQKKRSDDNKQAVKDRSQKQKNQQQSQSGDQEKTGKQENTKPDGSTTGNSNDITKKNLKENTNSDIGEKIKEIAKHRHVQVKEINEAKEGMEENFRETKSIDTNNNLEKLMLKNLEAQNDTNSNSANQNTGDQKTGGDEKAAKEFSIENKQPEPDIDVKETKTNVKQEFRVDQKDSKQDNSALNLLNNQLKEIRQINEIHVKKEITQHQNTLLEQYQELRDRITNGVENSIKLLVSGGENKITMQLQPPELGKVQVELVVKDNRVNARINTENTAVKEVIMTNLDQLKSNLENAGTQINKFDVEVGGFRSQFDQQFAQEKSNGKQRGKQGGGQGQAAFQENKDPGPGKVWNQKPLSYSLGRSINCLI